MADLMWLWSLLGVIALFVLGVIAYNARSRNVESKKKNRGPRK